MSNGGFGDALDRFVRTVEHRESAAAVAGRTFDALEKRLRLINASMQQRTDQRLLRPVVSIDAERVMALMTAGRVDDLTSREARFAARNYRIHDPAQVVRLLRERPFVARTLARQMFADWHDIVTQPARLAATQPLIAAVASIPGLVECPVPLQQIFTQEGPVHCASALTATSFLDAHTCLTNDWMLGRTWVLTTFVLTALMCLPGSAARGFKASAAVKLLATRPDHDDLRRLLLPVRTARAQSSAGHAALGNRTGHWHFVAGLLQARFGSRPTVNDAAFSATEEWLLDGEFGDPRVQSVSQDWNQVRVRSAQAYEAFFESLVRGDLEFFFAEAMNEPDRKRFWLQYTRSIRRTIAIIDAEVYRTLLHKLRTEEGPMLAALRRAKRAGWSRQDELSAFCLVFDKVVAVEFSLTGNALYLYGKAHFDTEILPLLDDHSALGDPRELKDPEIGQKLTHMGNWQPRVSAVLLQSGIFPEGAVSSARRT